MRRSDFAASTRGAMQVAAAVIVFTGCGGAVEATDHQQREPADCRNAISASPAVQNPRKYLRELTPVAGEPASGAAEVNGNLYINSITLSPNSPWEDSDRAEYNLSRDWKCFTAIVGVRDDAPSDAIARVEVTGDGQVLLKKDLALGTADAVALDVSRVLRLELKSITISGDDVYLVVFGDASLTK